MQDRQDSAESQGFGMSRRRTLVELAIIVAVLALGVGLVLGSAGALAAWLTPSLSPQLDISLGKALSQQQRFLGRRCENRELQAYVANLTGRLTRKLKGSPFSYEFTVIESDEVNAYALPGGFVTINFGLIRHAQSGEELAAVLAHEIQHVELRHSARSLLRQLSGWTALGIIFGDTGLQVPAYLLANTEFLSNSREQEAEADRLGLELMVRAGIRPSGLAAFFRRRAAESLSLPEFFSTHPDPGNRATVGDEQARQHRNFPKLPELKELRCQ